MGLSSYDVDDYKIDKKIHFGSVTLESLRDSQGSE
jgi:hypothetical protein